VPHDLRDVVVDFLHCLHERTELPLSRLIGWLGISRPKFYDWRARYGKVNEHNALIPRDHWLLPQEKQAILDYHARFPLEGYRRLTFMMLDQDIVACSTAGLLDRWNKKPSKKGTGFVQPLRPHEHWHIDISYLNLSSTFYYLCSVLDGASRVIVHFEVRERMTELDVECILQRAREKYPEARPRIISDNGPQFIAGEFKTFIRVCGMTHVRTSPYYPQSNGKLERWHKSVKSEAIRPANPATLEEAVRILDTYVQHYNCVRLHSALDYIAPLDFMNGLSSQIWTERDRRLEDARLIRAQRRAQLHGVAAAPQSAPVEVACA
jgi:transposase InsO family protein